MYTVTAGWRIRVQCIELLQAERSEFVSEQGQFLFATFSCAVLWPLQPPIKHNSQPYSIGDLNSTACSQQARSFAMVVTLQPRHRDTNMAHTELAFYSNLCDRKHEMLTVSVCFCIIYEGWRQISCKFVWDSACQKHAFFVRFSFVSTKRGLRIIYRLISFTNFNAQFLYSLTICMLHYYPRHV